MDTLGSQPITGKRDTVLIFDFGGQYCHLIGRRIREQGVYTETVPYDISPEKVFQLKKQFNVKGLIFSGGPASVLAKKAPRCNPKILTLGIPILGLCYGHQLIAQAFGGQVESSQKKEYGLTYIHVDKPIGVLKGLENKECVWMSHGDTVLNLPPGFTILAHSDNDPVAAFCDKSKSIYGLQWHPEVHHTPKGTLMLRNFIFEVCKCKANWSMENVIENAVIEIKKAVNDGKCILALSGGIDSGTAAILASKAVGDKLTAVFVDNGFMRTGEPEAVKEAFSKFNLKFIICSEQNRFLKKLQGVRDPEKKRKIIGREFIRVFEKVAKSVGADYLIQGTIYPDRIESGYSKNSEKIKTHHNVGGMPTKIAFKAVIEPLKELYKDEVRKIAERLDFPEELVWRQPFPGPGLAVRIMGEVTKEKLDLIKIVDEILTEEIEKIELKNELWQYFPVFTETQSTGVMGDARAYGYTIAIRAVESKDGMTAKFARIPYDVLDRISTRITNEVPKITRIVYDISNKPPATIEWE